MDGASGPPTASTGVFPATAYLDPANPVRSEGVLRVLPAALQFETADRILDLSLDGLGVRIGGASDRIVFFSHPDHPGVSVFLPDIAILAHPALAARADVAAQIGGMKSRGRRTWAGIAALAAAVVLIVVGLFAAKDPVVGVVVDRIPPSLEVQLGDALFTSVEATGGLVRDPDVDARLGALVAPLVAAVPERDAYEFRFHVVDDPTLNAYAMPGGNIVLHSGLVLAAERPEEILGVLGHEMAHVTRRHSTRQIVGDIGVFALLQVFLGDVSSIVAVVAQSGAQLGSLAYSRDHEREADEVGWDYLVAARIDPSGLADFFGRLEAEQAKNPLASVAGENLTFMSTHPGTEERIESLRARIAAEGVSFDPVDFDLKAFQDAVRSATHKAAQ